MRGDDVLFGDFRRLTEPITVFFLSDLLRHDFHGNFPPLAWGNALGGGLVHSARSNGRARDDVDFSGLSRHKGLLQRFGGGLTDGGRFVGDVEHHVGNFVGVEGHRHNDVADAGRLGGIRAGFVDARGCRMYGSGGERGTASERRTKECTTGKLLGHGWNSS